VPAFRVGPSGDSRSGSGLPPEGSKEVDSQLTARFTRATILASSVAVSFVSAKSVGHM
jgi:hypothetical protein